MDEQTLLIWSIIAQSVAGLGAVSAAVIALCISAKDRQAADARAAQSSATQITIMQTQNAFQADLERLKSELDALLRLSENLSRGGSADPLESAKMGAEAQAIAGMIGPEKLPLSWRHSVELDDKDLAEFANRTDTPDWMRKSIEAKIALSRTVAELRQLREHKDK